MAKYTDRFQDLDSNAIDDLIAEAEAYKRQLKGREQQQRIEKIMKSLTIGSTAYTKNKNQIVKGTVKALTEKSATLLTEDGKKMNRRYSKIALRKEDVN